MELSERTERPLARAEGLVVRELPEEVLVYDLDTHKAMCLNRTAALVWKNCDGRRDVAAIARALSAEFDAPVAEEVVWLALERLSRERLLAERVRRPASRANLPRREVIKKLGLAAAIALPAITAIVAPTAAQAASCTPVGGSCQTSAQCCDSMGNPGQGLCVGNTCVPS
jgi:hypothetical protein